MSDVYKSSLDYSGTPDWFKPIEAMELLPALNEDRFKLSEKEVKISDLQQKIVRQSAKSEKMMNVVSKFNVRAANPSKMFSFVRFLATALKMKPVINWLVPNYVDVSKVQTQVDALTVRINENEKALSKLRQSMWVVS